jgi:prephenate dehydrogenase
VRPDRLAVLGLGAIGGSVAWQARLAGITPVLGWSPRRGDAVAALTAGAVDDIADRIDRAVGPGTVVVVALPFAGLDDVLRRISRKGAPVAVGLVAEVAGPALSAAAAAGLGAVTAAVHPLGLDPGAGFAGARPDLLRGRVVYVSPSPDDRDEAAARTVMSFVGEVLEAEPVLIGADRHDEQVAWTSDLPRAAAVALARTLADRGLAGASWGPAARQAAAAVPSDPAALADALVANAAAVGAALERFGDDVMELRRRIASGDRAAVAEFVAEAGRFRPGGHPLT